MKLPAWLAALRKEEIPPEVKSQGHDYERLVSRIRELKQQLLSMRGRLDELRAARKLLEKRAVEADASIASMGLLRRLFYRIFRNSNHDYKAMAQHVEVALRENEAMIQDVLRLSRHLMDQVTAVRAEKDRALIRWFLTLEEMHGDGEHPFTDAVAERVPSVFRSTLTAAMQKKFDAWRSELATSATPGGFLERNLSYEELGFRFNDLHEQAERIAAAASTAMSEPLFEQEVQALLHEHFEGIEARTDLRDQLLHLFQAAYSQAEQQAIKDVSAELKEQQMDRLVSDLSSE